MEREEPGSSSEAPMPLAVVARHSLKFDILSLKFDQSGQHLAVAGLRDIQVGVMHGRATLRIFVGLVK